jgi:YHS domain-containing protein
MTESPSAEGLYGGQVRCPVTGAPLESMGTPVPVTLNGQTVYVCCRACVGKAQRDPDGYLRKVQADHSLPSG